MDIILVVVFYALTANGDLTKTVYETKSPHTYEQCEFVADLVKKDKYLNTPSSYVFSAECELRKPAE